MKYVLTKGRFQEITHGTLWDLYDAYQTATGAFPLEPAVSLGMSTVSGSVKASAPNNVLDTCGTADRLLVALAVQDFFEVQPGALPQKTRQTAIRFRSTNVLNWFSRMFLLKHAITQEPKNARASLKAIDFVPDYHPALHPSRQKVFLPHLSDILFEYASITKPKDEGRLLAPVYDLIYDRHTDENVQERIRRLAPYRGLPSERDMAKTRFNVMLLYFGSSRRHAGDTMPVIKDKLEQLILVSERNNMHAVAAVYCPPITNGFGTNTFDVYAELRQHSAVIGADTRRMHFSMLPTASLGMAEARYFLPPNYRLI
jgi:hypothetical protein